MRPKFSFADKLGIPCIIRDLSYSRNVMAHLAVRAFHLAAPPFPLLHIDSTWELRSVLQFRDEFARQHGFKLVVRAKLEGCAAGLNPFNHGEHYTAAKRTEPLKAALDQGGHDMISAARAATRRNHVPPTGGPAAVVWHQAQRSSPSPRGRLAADCPR